MHCQWERSGQHLRAGVALYLNHSLWPFTALNSVLTQLWCNPECCLTAPIFHVGARMWSSTAGQDALPGHDKHHTDDLAGSLGLSCVRGASLEETLGEDSPLATNMPATPANRGAT